jgi:hypothetical protein
MLDTKRLLSGLDARGKGGTVRERLGPFWYLGNVTYPPELEPVGNEKVVLPSGKEDLIPKAAPTFQPWRGEPKKETFGGKPSLDWDGSSTFAEAVILRHF